MQESNETILYFIVSRRTSNIFLDFKVEKFFETKNTFEKHFATKGNGGKFQFSLVIDAQQPVIGNDLTKKNSQTDTDDYPVGNLFARRVLSKTSHSNGPF